MWLFIFLLLRINSLEITWKNNQYYVLHDDEIFASGGRPAFYFNGKWNSDAFVNMVAINGEDNYGKFQGQQQSYKSADGVNYQTQTRNYDGFIMFSYTISDAVSTKGLQRNDILQNFPLFKSVSTENVLSWSGSFVQGKREATYGTQGGPYMFYNDSVSGPCFIASATNNFLVTSRSKVSFDGSDASWAPGIAGTAQSLPAKFSHSFIVVVGNGITDTVYKWGQILQKAYKAYKIEDLTLTHIGYQTDNGAQYCFCRSDCNNVLLNVTSTLSKQGIQLGYLSFQGAGASSSNGKAPWCVSKWGVDGGLGHNYPMDLKSFHDQIQLPLQLYAPYFCNDTIYNTTFPMVESDPSLPKCGDFDFKDPAPEVSRKFYDWFFAKGEAVGMFSYEPDFMNQNYNCMPAFQGDISSGAKWSDGMAGAALAKNITVQWCYATPSWVMQALNYPAVTNFRGSFDYYYGSSYNVGFSSLFIWALGSHPSKDTFWTSDNGPFATTLGGCEKKGCPADHNEAGAELHTLLALMTTGPVGFSDAIGQTNATRLRRTCRADGALLKPDKAITSVDAMFSDRAPQHGSVYMTYSGSVDSPTAYYVVGFNLKDSFTLTGSDFWPPMSTNETFIVRECCDLDFKVRNIGFGGSFRELEIYPKDLTQPLLPTFLIISKSCMNGWSFLGDLGAYAAFSKLRIETVQCGDDNVRVEVRGVKGEVVMIGANSPDNEMKTKQISFEKDSVVSVTLQ